KDQEQKPMTTTKQEKGFSTVELLIALFVAAAFIATSFQLFSIVMQDGNQARLRAKAGSIANTVLQSRINSTNSPCSPTPSSATVPISSSDLPQASAAVTYSCPYGSSSKTTRVRVVVSYDSPAKQVEGSLDVTK